MKSKAPAPPIDFIDTATRWIGPRGRRILQTGAWSIIAKLAAAANLFLTVPFVLHALGPAQFGAWATLLSLSAFTGFLDFGLANGTMNLIAAAHGRGATDEIGSILREGSRTLLWIALWLAVAVLIAIPLVPWYLLLGMPKTMGGDSRAAAAAVFFTVVLSVPLNLSTRVQLGLGQGNRAYRWQALGQSLTLGTVILLAKTQASLVVLTAAAVATPLLASAANTFMLWRDPAVAASSTQSSRNTERTAHIRREGLSFFVLQLAAALAFSADLPLISALYGSAEAGNYAIVQRLFSTVTLGLSLVWAPLWPIYRHALAAGDYQWVMRTFRRSLLFAGTFSATAAITLAVGFNTAIHLWVHRPVLVSSFLLVGFALWCFVDAIGTATGTLLNAASILRYQLILAPIFACVSLTLKTFSLQHNEIDTLPWITLSCYVFLVLIPLAARAKSIRMKIMTAKY